MYNEELKSRFITEFSTSLSRRQVAYRTFELIQPFEEEWDADFCTRSVEEIQPILEQMVGVRMAEKNIRVEILKSYSKWCIKNNVEGACDSIYHIGKIGVERMRSQMVANPQHLQRYLNSICEPESEKSVSSTYRCYFWLAFSGVSEPDSIKIREQNVDFMNMVISYENREYQIYREEIPALRNCVQLTGFNFNHPNRKTVVKPRADGDLLLRGFSPLDDLKTLRQSMSRCARKQKYRDRFSPDDSSVDLRLSYYRVWLSGLYYRMYEAERAGMPVDFRPAAKDHMEGKEFNLTHYRDSPEVKEMELARNYKKDYDRWKEAYMI